MAARKIYSHSHTNSESESLSDSPDEQVALKDPKEKHRNYQHITIPMVKNTKMNPNSMTPIDENKTSYTKIKIIENNTTKSNAKESTNNSRKKHHNKHKKKKNYHNQYTHN
eukprot:152995_1